jgi:hypothetical protein
VIKREPDPQVLTIPLFRPPLIPTTNASLRIRHTAGKISHWTTVALDTEATAHHSGGVVWRYFVAPGRRPPPMTRDASGMRGRVAHSPLASK